MILCISGIERFLPSLAIGQQVSAREGKKKERWLSTAFFSEVKDSPSQCTESIGGKLFFLLPIRVRTHYFHTLQKRVGMETEVTMSTLFYLSSAQMDTIRPFFPRSRGVPRVDDQKILSGIIYVLKFGLQWKDAPKEYGPYKTLYNRFVRWSKMGVFEKIFTALAENSQDTSLLMIDATHLKAHRTAASLRKKGLLPDVSDEQRED